MKRKMPMLLLKILGIKENSKTYIYSIKAVLITALFFLQACGTQQTSYYTIRGLTMGTSYNITYKGKDPKSVQKAVDEVLEQVNQSLSTYIPNSTISKVNGLDTVCSVDQHFINVYNEALNVYKATNGAFEPTIAPLVNAWGFGFKNYENVDSSMIDSLMQFVGFDKVKLSGNTLIKNSPYIQIDFSAIAKGYGVDVVAAKIKELGYNDYLVEIGGEVIASGLNKNNLAWNLGIEEPKREEHGLFAQVLLEDQALATSGNYKNYRIENGETFVHTIDPRTGYSSKHKLLSASIVSNTCMRADAFATAFMVLGLDEAKKISEKPKNNIDVFLIYEDENKQMNYYKSKALNKKARLSF